MARKRALMVYFDDTLGPEWQWLLSGRGEDVTAERGLSGAVLDALGRMAWRDLVVRRGTTDPYGLGSAFSASGGQIEDHRSLGAFLLGHRAEYLAAMFVLRLPGDVTSPDALADLPVVEIVLPDTYASDPDRVFALRYEIHTSAHRWLNALTWGEESMFSAEMLAQGGRLTLSEDVCRYLMVGRSIRAMTPPGYLSLEEQTPFEDEEIE